MRIIGGTHKGRHIHAPNNLPVRPTTDFAKEGLFNVLSNRYNLEGKKILDLFSGTGNLALEFASRGASLVVAVDQNKVCTHFITKTAEQLHLNSLQVVQSEVFKFLKNAIDEFDVVICDPPYEFGKYNELVDTLINGLLCKKDKLLIIEHPDKINFKEKACFLEERKYGNVHFSFFTT